MYICGEECDSFLIRDTDGSQSELSLSPGPDNVIDATYHPRVCSDDGIVVSGEFGDLTKFSKGGEFLWKIETGCDFRFCLNSSDFLYCATGELATSDLETSDSNQIRVYLPNGAFSHVLVSNINYPMAIAIDGDNNAHVGFSSSIQVFSAKGKLIREYGHELVRVCNIAISRDNPQLVVAAKDHSSQLFVFNSTGSFLYTVTGVTCVGGMTFGSDNSLWIIGYDVVVRVPKLFHQLPPPLSYLCELSILPHLNELPVSLLPPRLAGLFEKWTRLVTVEVKCRSYTDYPSKSKLISETIELNVEPDAPVEMVKWLVEKKMDLRCSAIAIRHGGDEGVDFVVNDREL